MKPRPPVLSIVILSYNEQENLKVCLRSLAQQTESNFEIVVVDNASTDGSAVFVDRYHTHVRQLRLIHNGGYGAGNNVGMRDCFERGAELVLLLNADTIADENLVKELLATYHSKKGTKIGLVQAVILLEQDHTLVNTVGNASHYCGFGYCRDLNRKLVDLQLIDDQPIVSASGACLLVSRQYFETVGQLDEDFFMYHEDQNYSWRGTMRGYTHYLSTAARLYHHYNFNKNSLKMYHSEKNRWLMLLENYQWTTLLVLSPLFIMLEGLLLLHALLSGWFWLKIKSYGYLLTQLGAIFRKRRVRQRTRRVSDGAVLRKFTARLSFAAMDSPLIQVLLNPVLAVYYRCVLAIIRQ